MGWKSLIQPLLVLCGTLGLITKLPRSNNSLQQKLQPANPNSMFEHRTYLLLDNTTSPFARTMVILT
jgi:hypothetical protein